MKKFNASDLSKKPKELFEAARQEGAIIQHKDRQGVVVEEFVICLKKDFMFDCDCDDPSCTKCSYDY